MKTTSSTIRHTTVESTTATTSSTDTTSTVQPGDPECEELGCPYGTNFVGSKNSDKYHYCSCSYAKSINSTNLVCFNNTEEAEEKGYTQSSCQPSSTTTSSTSSSTVESTTTQGTTSSTTTTVISGTHIGEIHQLDPEWVEIISDIQVDMTNWNLSDNSTHVYHFPSGFNLLESVKVHTEHGIDNSTDLYWNLSISVWNNDHDVATLKDNEGNIVDQKNY
jgi:hypothetical protein